jgi:type I restriction enzyme S subunit
MPKSTMEWAEVKLGDVLQRIRKPVDVQPSTIYHEIGIRSHGKGLFYKEERTGASLGDKAVFWVEPDCFVVNIVFAWEQAVAKTTTNESGMIASHRFPMFKPLPEKLDLDYLLYFFQSPRGKHLLGLASPGGAGRNKTLGKDAFQKLAIPLPTLSEQLKIAAILGTWDKAIALIEQLITIKQQIRKGLMQVMLTGKKRFDGFGSPLQNGRYLPYNWTEARLEEVFTRINRPVPNQVQHVLSITANVGFVDQREKFGRLIAGKNLARYVLLKKGEFAYNKGNSKNYPQGCIYMLEEFETGAVPNVYYSFVSKSEETHAPFYKYYFQNGALNTQLRRLINAGVRNNGLLNLAADEFFGVKITIPPLEEQCKIAAVLQSCDDELFLLKQKLATTHTQKKGLMQQLLTGKVRVTV